MQYELWMISHSIEGEIPFHDAGMMAVDVWQGPMEKSHAA